MHWLGFKVGLLVSLYDTKPHELITAPVKSLIPFIFQEPKIRREKKLNNVKQENDVY